MEEARRGGNWKGGKEERRGGEEERRSGGVRGEG